MKRWIKNFFTPLFAAAVFACGVAFTACDSAESSGPSSDSIHSAPVNVYGVDISTNACTLNLYDEIELSAVATKDGAAVDATIAWVSSDPTVATVENGKVSALKVGSTMITATANGVSSTCVITVVDAAGAPQLVVDVEETLQVLAGETFLVQPTLVYNGKVYTDATYTYVSEDPTIFTVDGAGLIAALKEGEANLTVSASWRGVSGESLTETIRVKVIEDIAIELSGTETTTIYTSNKDFGDGKTYNTTVTYGAEVYYNGALLEGDTGAIWSSSDTGVATVDAQTGVVTAVGVGETSITLTYLSSTGKAYVSEEIRLSVVLPYAEKNIEILMGAADTVNPLLGADIFEDGDNQAIASITNITDGQSQPIAYADGKVTAELQEGNQQWMITNGEYGYIVNVLVATNVIRTAEDLKIFDFTVATNTFAGTYVLANNIDASGYTHYTQKNTANANGLTGTFDGRGYTIDGITLKLGGLFGNIGGGSVQNVAFTNVKLSGTHAYTLAYSVWHKSKISNVYVHIGSWPSDTDKITAAALYGWLRTPHEGMEISNVMVVAPATAGTVNAVGSVKVTVSDEGGTQHTGMYSNVFVLSPVATNVEGIENYSTLEAFNGSVNVNVLTSDVWDLTGDYPIFKTSEMPEETPGESPETPPVTPDEPLEITITETGKEIVFGAADKKNPLVVSQFAQDTSFVATAILNAADNTEIAYDATSGQVTATLTEGKYEWIIHNGEYGYKVNVWVATNAIRTAEDLAIFSVPDNATYLAGTYVLANDIDATSYVHCMNIGWSSKANGLTGTFDGRGHSIDGITIRQGGLFGVISSGKVLNVAFTNVKLSSADDKGGMSGNNLYVLATLVWYGVSIDNVFVEIDQWIGSSAKTTAALFHSVKKATPAISNVVIITAAAAGGETTVAPVVCNATNATFTNVYVISPITSTAITGVVQYADVDTFKANVTTSALTGFNEYWDLTGDYPIFTTAK